MWSPASATAILMVLRAPPPRIGATMRNTRLTPSYSTGRELLALFWKFYPTLRVVALHDYNPIARLAFYEAFDKTQTVDQLMIATR